MTCTILSPRSTDRYQHLQSVTLPAFSGQMQARAGHAESFLLLKKGALVMRRTGQPPTIVAIAGGHCYINNDLVTVILPSTERADN